MSILTMPAISLKIPNCSQFPLMYSIVNPQESMFLLLCRDISVTCLYKHFIFLASPSYCLAWSPVVFDTKRILGKNSVPDVSVHSWLVDFDPMMFPGGERERACIG